MSYQIAALVSTLVVSIVSLCGIVFLSLSKELFSKLMFVLFSFAVGALLGNAFFDLLPESYEQITNKQLIAWLILGGFLAFFIIEQFLGHRSSKSSESVKSYGYLCLFADGVHNFTDGVLIGAAWLAGPEIGISTTAGILMHEIPQEISDFAILIKAGFSRRKALLFNFYSALSAILGTALILIFNEKIHSFSIYILPFAAGGFIFLAAASLMPELTRNSTKRQVWLQFGIILLGLLMMFWLGGHGNHEHKHSQPQNTETLLPDSTLTINHAKNFSIEYFNDYKRVTVKHRDDGSVYAHYYLVKNKDIETPTDGQKIITPIRSLAATSGTQFEFVSLIGELNSITGVCSPQLIYNQTIKKNVDNGKIADLGDFLNLNIEKTQMLRPNAVMISGDFQESALNKRLLEMGIPVISNNEWTEQTLLGRTEWIKFVAAFYEKEHTADSIFREIENRYKSIKEKVQNISQRPTVLSGGNFKGTWYVPGGKSYMANLFSEAGGNYFYADNKDTKSLPLSFETVLTNFKNADVWVGCPANSLTELAAADERHKLFDAFRNNRACNFNARTTPSGGNDFWESGVAHPDLVLADMIKVFHPEVITEHEFTYIKWLTE